MSKKTNAPVILSNQYYNINQFRTKLWTSMKTESFEIAHRREHTQEYKELITSHLKALRFIEPYWAFPGMECLNELNNLLKMEEYVMLAKALAEINKLMVSDDFRYFPGALNHVGSIVGEKKSLLTEKRNPKRYFEVLITDRFTQKEEHEIREKFLAIQEEKELFGYRAVFAKSFQDTLIALIFNPNIQACVIRYGIKYKSKNINEVLLPFISQVTGMDYSDHNEESLGVLLGEVVKKIRPELDIYYVTDTPVSGLSDSVLQNFKRISGLYEGLFKVMTDGFPDALLHFCFLLTWQKSSIHHGSIIQRT